MSSHINFPLLTCRHLETIQKCQENLDKIIGNVQRLMKSMPESYHRNQLQDEIKRLHFINDELKEVLKKLHKLL